MALSEQAELAVRISLKDNVSPGVSKLQRNLGGLNTSLGRAGKGVGQVGLGLAKAGVVIGTAVGTGLVLAAKAAIDFEDAFAGVRKTVDASGPELDKIYSDLRALATRIPVKFTDLAQIAQEAGALGVATGDVVGFTDVVARLSAATVGLTTEAAAEAFGKLGNVLFTEAQKADGLVQEYGQMGSALVALGNAGASSEGDIIEVAKRFGAAGRAAGLNAAQVLGFSSAIASLGVEPEAAGSSLSRIFGNITKYLGTGDKKAKAFADTAKLTVGQFKDLYAKDATGAVQLFLKNLSGLDKFQQAAVLKSAGITNIRDISAIQRLAQNYPELIRQLNLSSKAYDENIDLQNVSDERFKTLKNEVTRFKNVILDAGVVMAERFTPAVSRAIDKVSALIALPGTQTALKNIGTDIGSAIDNINWENVKSGAIAFTGLLKGALSAALLILQAIDKLPGPLKEAGLGFLALNKLSGGLIGAGAGNIVGGLLGALTKGLAAKIPVVGSAFAQPVFVTNWPPGGLGPGGPGGPKVPGGLAGSLLGGASWASFGTAIGLAFIPVLVAELALALRDPNADKIQSDYRAAILAARGGTDVTGVHRTGLRGTASGEDFGTKVLGIPLSKIPNTTLRDPSDLGSNAPRPVDVTGPTARSTAAAQLYAQTQTRSAVLAGGAGMIGALRALNLSPTINVTAPVSISVSSVTRATHTTATYSSGTIATRIAGGQVYGI